MATFIAALRGVELPREVDADAADKVLEQIPELRKMTIHVGSLSLEDM